MVSQTYTVNLMEENVLRGNAAILKCHIPSFVTEYVTVTSWIISEGEIDKLEIKVDDASNLGTTITTNEIPKFHSSQTSSKLHRVFKLFFLFLL